MNSQQALQPDPDSRPLATARLRRAWAVAIRLAPILVLLMLLCFAGWLRWRYLRTVSLYVDEFTTLWAARQVQEHGAPLMPSGVLYTRGLLASYLEALFLTLFGFSYTIGRLPNFLLGLATIITILLMGRRWWRPGVGWLAAVALALLPEAIMWSGRARFYAQLQFFTLLLVWAALQWVVTGDTSRTDAKAPPAAGSRKAALFFSLFFILALYSQEETLLLYPALLLTMLLWRGWRFFFRSDVLLAHLVCLLAIGLRFVIEIVGQPGYFETIQAQRPYIGFIFDVQGAYQSYAPLLLAPERLPWTLSALVALGVALARLRSARWRLGELSRFHQATLFVSLQFWFVVVLIFSLVGTSWRDPRYLFWVQPLWLLLGAAGALWLLERLTKLAGIGARKYVAGWGTAALCIATVVSLFPSAERAVNQQVEGYDKVLGYLASVRQAGDVILSPQPAACALLLGQCDFYALQRGYEEFVIPRTGQWIDRWTGAPLLNTTAQLAETIRRAPHTWFVVDGFRLATRYEADFVQAVVDQFELAHQERGVMALRASGWTPPPAQPITRTLTPPITFAPLALTGWQRNAAQPGAELVMTFFWQGTEPITQQFNTSLRVVGADGVIVAQVDGPPARGLIPTTLFFETPRPDPKRLSLPAELAPGRYRLDVVAYDVATLTPLGEPYAADWFTVGPPPSPPSQPLDIHWQNGLQLLGMDQLSTRLQPGADLTVRLLWSTGAPVAADYSVFVHLVDENGVPLAQSDRAPENGFYPTSAWRVDEPVADWYTLAVPADAPPGECRLVAGLYQPATGERLPLVDGAEVVVLQRIKVQ